MCFWLLVVSRSHLRFKTSNIGSVLHASFLEHAVDVHVPGDADVRSQCVVLLGEGGVGIFYAVVAVGDKSVDAHVFLAEGGGVLEAYAVGGIAVARIDEAVEARSAERTM